MARRFLERYDWSRTYLLWDTEYARNIAGNRLLAVEEQYERPRTADGPDEHWSNRVNGIVPTGGVDSALPSRPWPAWIQFIVRTNRTTGIDLGGNRHTVETSPEPVR